MQETQEVQVQSLGQEAPLEEEMATHSGILAWKISMGKERSLTGYSPWGCRAGHNLAWTHTRTHTNIHNSNQSSLKTETHPPDYSGFPFVCLLFRPSSRSPFIDCLPGPHPKPHSVQKSKPSFSHLKEKKM